MRRVWSGVTAEIKTLGRIILQFEIAQDWLRGGLAIIAFEELLNQFAVVLLRVPEQLREHPRTQPAHFAAPALIRAFGKHAAHIVFGEQPRVRATREAVRMRTQ